ncbi:OmpA family protein [Phenylobacterium sp. VNQ135]|uniref:OmpA family protein n=1 Tax=Phenylobacterium sp. VNQ135 TaxID=3400922 RepID=UPI003C0D06A3
MPASSKTRLMAAASVFCLALAAPASTAALQAAGSREPQGRRLDRSQVRVAPPGPNTEREDRAFAPLGGSAAVVREMRPLSVPPASPAPTLPPLVISDRVVGAGFASGRADLRPEALAELQALVARVRGKPGLRFEIVGHTDNQPISARLRPVMPSNQALSEARAAAVARHLAQALEISSAQIAVSGRGESDPAATNDTPEGRAANRRVVIQVWYETPAPVPAPPPPPTPPPLAPVVTADPCAPAAPGGQPFAISIDGVPQTGDTTQQEADRQRCVDVALQESDIQVRYDPLDAARSLNVWPATGVVGRDGAVTWLTQANYSWWIKSAEVRVFTSGQTTDDTPVAVLPVEIGQPVTWRPPADVGDTIGYVLRVYDAEGRFDETALKTVDRLDMPAPRQAAEAALAGWGESSLKLSNIPLDGAAVTVSGKGVARDQTVSALGAAVPVDADGAFVVRQILPEGAHQVEVEVKGADGVAQSFARNLAVARKDLFYVVTAEVTAAKGRTTGPAALVTGDDRRYDDADTLDGRIAFYLKGKVLDDIRVTASADTREQPIGDLFSNFARKDPDYLLRRIDPNRYYPVYGDDSTVVDDAPTQGKFYVRAERGASHLLFGNFHTAWTGTELTQYTRGLYGGQLVWNSAEQMETGERRTRVELFAAEPGTLQSREEFRGTGGSLYYLRRKDLTEGSERIWVEVRDADSGLVLQRTLLEPAQDYEIDYLQGRLTLRAPLSSTAEGGGLVAASSLDGNPVYLVASYEYVPGLTEVEGAAVGVRASHWLNDVLRLGASHYREGDDAARHELSGLDVTIRRSAGSWLRGEVARSEGAGTGALTSLTGGFDFSQNTAATRRKADAWRLDAAMDLNDFMARARGRVTAYAQQRDAGFSGPGLLTPGGEGLRQEGVAAVVPIAERAEIAVKADALKAGDARAESAEAAVRVKLNDEWGLSAGVRHDDRTLGASGLGGLQSASPTLNRSGERTDAVVRLDFRPLAPAQAASETGPAALPPPAPATATLATSIPGLVGSAPGPAGSLLATTSPTAPGALNPLDDPAATVGVAATRTPGLAYRPYNLYAFAQGTLARTGDREANDRAGVGLGWQVSERLRLGAQVSDGTGGVGGKLSTDYALNDRSTLYLTYARESESPELNYGGRRGVLTAGGRTRLTDQLGLFAETRQASGEGPSSLTRAFGVDFAPAQAWTTGVKAEFGRLSDRLSGDVDRKAVSLNLGYKDERLKAATVLELIRDETTRLGTADGSCAVAATPAASPCVAPAGSDTRETVLSRTSLSYQATPDWRALAALNLSRSASSEGAFYDGDYTEAVLAAAYRPAAGDRLNALFKYTYFYNLPASSQIDGSRGRPIDYTQRSHVLNVDAIYDVTSWLSLGAKYGLRIGELRDSRTGGPWYDSQAQLLVGRADLHFVREWDATLELRNLRVKETKDDRTGALVAIYRHVGDNAKVGVGYNFTDYSDDLTDLSYRNRGLFLNVLAKF